MQAVCDAAERKPGRPDRPQLEQQLREDDRGCNRAVRGHACEAVEQSAGTRHISCYESIGCGRDNFPENAKQREPAFQADQRIVIRYLKSGTNRLGGQSLQRVRISARTRTTSPAVRNPAR